MLQGDVRRPAGWLYSKTENVSPLMCGMWAGTCHCWIILMIETRGTPLAPFALTTWPVVFWINCRELSTSVNVKSMDFLFGVQAPRVCFLSNETGGPECWDPNQGGHAWTDTWVAWSRIAVEDCSAMQLLRKIRQIFLWCEWTGCRADLCKSQESGYVTARKPCSGAPDREGDV